MRTPAPELRQARESGTFAGIVVRWSITWDLTGEEDTRLQRPEPLLPMMHRGALRQVTWRCRRRGIRVIDGVGPKICSNYFRMGGGVEWPMFVTDSLNCFIEFLSQPFYRFQQHPPVRLLLDNKRPLWYSTVKHTLCVCVRFDLQFYDFLV